MARVAQCAEADFDPVAGTCDAITWVDSSTVGFLPSLTVEQGGEIAGAIAGLWIIAWAWRELSRQLRDSETEKE